MNQFGIKVYVSSEKNEKIFIDYQKDLVNFYESLHPLLVSILTNHVIATCEEKWLYDIIREVFYYQDQEEIEQIIAIARSILEGDRKDIPSLKPFFERSRYIYEAFAKGIDDNTTFYYDPFLTFRLKHYGELLINCVEMAIDEYLLEQEYQNLIDSFRKYIHSTEHRVSKIFLVHQNKQFDFYNDRFEKLSNEAKQQYLKKELIFEEDVPISEMVISPLVSLNPQEIIIFTDSQEDGVIYSIQTIFEERVKVMPLHDFAFSVNK